MGYVTAILTILKFVSDAGGFKKAAEFIDRHREELLRMQAGLEKPGHSKGY